MATGWGPISHPVTEGKTTGSPDGAETLPDEHGNAGSPEHAMNYDATDGRHSKPNHEGWETVDVNGGCVADGDWASVTSKFADGPGPWRQT
jgi:hypothetical protein